MKKMLSTIVCLILLFSLAACSKKDSAGTPVVSPAPAAISRSEPKDSTTSGIEDAPSDEAVISATENASEDVQEPADDGIRPEFRDMMDSYEVFFDQYIAFMQKMEENPDDLTILAEYADYMQAYADTMEKMDAVDDGSLSDAEELYYLEVTTRITQKLMKAAQ